MKYPYIGEGKRGSIVLFSADSSGFAISHENKTVKGKYTNHWDERAFTDITREYLQNTYGVVESKEHAEFIIELAERAGFNSTNKYKGHLSFAFYPSGNFSFHQIEIGELITDKLKQITIPLSPKVKPNFSDLPKHFDCRCNKCGGKCCTGFCNAWPKVGDEVVAYDIGFEREMTVIYRGKNKNNASIVEFENGNVILLGFEGKIKKPKTPEEELRDDLINTISSYLTFIPGMLDKSDEVMHASHQAACKLMSKYNITKKPQ